MADTYFSDELARAYPARFDLTGLVAGKAVLNEDTFGENAQGWGQLFTPYGQGSATGWGLTGKPGGSVSRLTRSLPVIQARTSHIASAAAMAIKRTGMYLGESRYLYEWVGCLSSITMDVSRPRWFEWGIDFETLAGSRRFCSYRWANSPTLAGGRILKFQSHQADGTWKDVHDQQIDLLTNTNENKLSPLFYLAFVVNVKTGDLEGFRYNDVVMLGALKPGATASDIAAYVAIHGKAFKDADLPAYIGGLNPLMNVENITEGSHTAAAMNMVWQRTTAIDVSGSGVPVLGRIMGRQVENNWLLANHPIAAGAGTVRTFEIAADPGAVYDIGVSLDSKTATAGTIALGIEFAPYEFVGYSIDAESSATPRPFVAIGANDNKVGHLMPDGQFPTPGLSFDDPNGTQVIRSLRAAANMGQFRLTLAQSNISANNNMRVTAVCTRRA